jgi:hypothetical protein
MEHKFIFTKRELEEFASNVWQDGFYDGNDNRKVSVFDRYYQREHDIEHRIKELNEL